MDPIIKIEDLSKAYRIGVKDKTFDTFGAEIANWLKTPFRNLRRIRSLSDLKINDEENSLFWALRNINLEIYKGEIIGIIGKNGAGKSTLLKLLAQITEPTTGEIIMRGRVASLLEVGTGFNPELTGRENVFLNGTILGMTHKEVKAKFDEIVDFSGVEKFIDTPVKRYSSGMKVRLAFSVAAHLDPEILIIDEVLAVGDMEFQRKCLGKMEDVSKGEGRTILFVSHDMTAIQGLTKRVIVLDQGQVIGDDTPEISIAKYVGFAQNNKSFDDTLLKDRKGDGVVQLANFEILNSEWKPINGPIFNGSPINFRINLRSEVEIRTAGLMIDIHVRDSLRSLMFTISTRFDPEFVLLNGNTFICQIAELPLAEDSYSMDYWISYNNGLADMASDFIGFEVVNSDYFKTGQMPVKRKHGPFLIKHKWN